MKTLLARTLRLLLILAAVVLAAFDGSSARVPADQNELKLTFAPVVRAAAPAVVNIYSAGGVARSPLAEVLRDPFFRQFFGDRGADRPPDDSLGSGVIVRPDGLIVTNHHVVERARQIRVVLADRRTFEAEVVADDATSDLAVLKIDVPGDDLPFLSFGDPDALEVGDLVLAIGNPFGIGQTVTSGIVSALGRTTPSLETAASFIQTDAAINPGNSGGALVDLDGRLIGINTAIFTRSGGSIGIGFAIPVNLAAALIRSSEEGEDHLERAWLGARVRPVDDNLAEALGLDRPTGLLVQDIYPGGPADRAGLERGDVLVKIAGFDVIDRRGLDFRLAVEPQGESVSLEVWRRGSTVPLALEIEPPPHEPPPAPARLSGRHPLGGIVVANLSPGFNREAGRDLFDRGVAVVDVAARSPARRIGLRPGDRLVSVDGVAIERVDQLRSVVDDTAPPWQLEIERAGRRLRVRVTG